MSSPFEDPDADYHVLRNDEEQHSLWPVIAAVPEGWTVVHGPAGREDCLAYVRANWPDLRPRSVKEFLTAHADEQQAA